MIAIKPKRPLKGHMHNDRGFVPKGHLIKPALGNQFVYPPVKPIKPVREFDIPILPPPPDRGDIIIRPIDRTKPPLGVVKDGIGIKPIKPIIKFDLPILPPLPYRDDIIRPVDRTKPPLGAIKDGGKIKPIKKGAPQIRVTGFVLDWDTQQPLKDVHVVIVGSKTTRQQGTITRDKGDFEIYAAANDMITFSRVGYEPMTFRADQVPFEIEMQYEMLDEIVIGAGPKDPPVKKGVNGWLIAGGIGLTALAIYAVSKPSKTKVKSKTTAGLAGSGKKGNNKVAI